LVQPSVVAVSGLLQVVAYNVADPTGTLLAAPAGDEVTVWDIESGLQLGRELPASPLLIEFNADGTLLSVPGTDRVTVWNYDHETWSDLACELAGRHLTAVEWDQFGPRTIDHRAIPSRTVRALGCVVLDDRARS
jgi:hypothetical protein